MICYALKCTGLVLGFAGKALHTDCSMEIQPPETTQRSNKIFQTRKSGVVLINFHDMRYEIVQTRQHVLVHFDNLVVQKHFKEKKGQKSVLQNRFK